MLIKTPKDKIKEYFASHGLSQSRLKLLPQGVAVFNKYGTIGESDLYFADQPALLVGSAADCLLTESRAAFDETYHMSDCPKPGEKIMSIVTQLFDREVAQLAEGQFPKTSLQDYDPAEVLECCNSNVYQMKWKPETRVGKVLTEGQQYYESLVSSVGKEILSLEQATVVQDIYNSITSHEHFRKYFLEEACPSDLDVYHQLIIHVTIRGVELQCLLDILEVNHTMKTLRVLDFKTMFDRTINFPNSVRQRRYDFQVVLYTLAVAQWMKTQPQLEGYTILNPGFIVETTAPGFQGNPLMFTITQQMFLIAIHGIRQFDQINLNADNQNPVLMQTKRVWGIYETIDLYKWHLENGFDQDRIVAENESKLKLNWEGIVYEDTIK